MEIYSTYNSDLLSAQSDSDVFYGLAAKFGRDKTNDYLVPGCFKNSILAQQPQLLSNHRYCSSLGEILFCREDNLGLWICARLYPDKIRADLYHQVRSGQINGLSIGFTTQAYKWVGSTRYIYDLVLEEVSIVKKAVCADAKIYDFQFLQ